MRVDRAVRWALAATGTASKLSRPGFDPHGSSEGPTAKAGGARARLHLIARAWADLFPYHLSEEFWAWVYEFGPEVIYTPIGSIRLIRLVSAISRRMGVPVVPHFMDDWPTTHYSGDPAVFLPRLVLKKSLKRLLKRSPEGMAIGVAMAEVYTSLRDPIPAVSERG